MNPIENIPSALAGRAISCSCGHTHAIPIRSIATGKGALAGLREMLADFRGKKVYLTGDETTLALGREAVCAQLAQAGCPVAEYMFEQPAGKHLVTDERLIGALLIHMPADTGLIVAVGSGTMNDVARAVSARCRIPYIIVATAPSMDGYASSVSAVVMDGGKKSVVLTTPVGVVGDVDLVKTAPDHMLASGAGDILGKYVAIRDWRLAQRETGEYFCPEIARLVLDTADRCAQSLPGLFDREDRAMHEMMDSLVMAGFAISMYGTSRPAAGLEHQIAHYWEVDAILKGTNTSLHGNYVGLGALAATRMYELAEQEFDLPGGEAMPSFRQMQEYMRLLKGYSGLEALGIGKDVFRKGILHAAGPEIRYTLASYLREKGKIEEYAGRLTEEFFA